MLDVMVERRDGREREDGNGNGKRWLVPEATEKGTAASGDDAGLGKDAKTAMTLRVMASTGWAF